jgi:transcriptional regulator with XRE-family HTH domain
VRRHDPRAGEGAGLIACRAMRAKSDRKELARRLKTSQQQISRLESPDYEGHSLANLRRVAEVLHARVRVVFEPEEKDAGKCVAEATASYGAKRASAKRS